MTPERALLARMAERLEALTRPNEIIPRGMYYQQCATDVLRWLTAEMAKLEKET